MLTTRQCIDQIRLFAGEKARASIEASANEELREADACLACVNSIIAIAEFLERHHQDIVNESIDKIDKSYKDLTPKQLESLRNES